MTKNPTSPACTACCGKGFASVYTVQEVRGDFEGDRHTSPKKFIAKRPCRRCKGTGITPQVKVDPNLTDALPLPGALSLNGAAGSSVRHCKKCGAVRPVSQKECGCPSLLTDAQAAEIAKQQEELDRGRDTITADRPKMPKRCQCFQCKAIPALLADRAARVEAQAQLVEKFYAAMCELDTPKRGELRRILIQLLPPL